MYNSPILTFYTILTTKRFQVSLSFPGEQRDYVSQVAELLADKLGKDAVFYDAWYKAELARPNLDTYLQTIYRQDSQLLVPFLCADYEYKEWCGLEWRAMRDLIKQKQDVDIMPLRFDETHISGLFSIDGYIDLRTHTPIQTAELILKRLQINSNAIGYANEEEGVSNEENGLRTSAHPINKIIEQRTKPILTVVQAHEEWQVIGKYKVNEGLTIDTKTGLMWLRFAYGQIWQNATTKGRAKEVNWSNAFEAVEEFNAEGGYAGYSDWRLPSVSELKTLINQLKGKRGNYIHPDVFPNNSYSLFWSSSTEDSYSDCAWSVNFYDGQGNNRFLKDNGFAVRFVRNEEKI